MTLAATVAEDGKDVDMAIRSRFVAILAAMALLVLDFPATTAAAQRDPAATVVTTVPQLVNGGCGTTCDYKSPYYYVYYCGNGCPDNWRCADDAITINENGSGPNLEYRYSPSCQTGWARGQGCYDPGGNLVVGLGNFSYYNQNWNTGKRAETWGPAASGVCYSRMLYIGGIWGVVAYSYGPGTTYSDPVYGY